MSHEPSSKTGEMEAIFETERLVIRRAVPADAGMYHALRTDSRVMTNVGFPCGLRISREEAVSFSENPLFSSRDILTSPL